MLLYLILPSSVRDSIHTHFVTLIGKWTIVGGCVKHRADKRGKVAKSKCKSFFTSLERADKKTGWVYKRDKVGMDGVPKFATQSSKIFKTRGIQGHDSRAWHCIHKI